MSFLRWSRAPGARPAARLLLVLFLPVVIACQASEPGSYAVEEETGIPIAEELRAFYDEHGGERVFGPPLRAAIIDEQGLLIQYFQSARLNYDSDPTTPVAQRVQVHPLGVWAFDPDAGHKPVAIPDGAAGRLFPDTDLTVYGEFLDFYESFAGSRLLGPPISNRRLVAGLQVQYFRNARLELWPSLPAALRVRLSPLGQLHFDQVMAAVYEARQDARPVPLADVTEAEIAAAAGAPILFAGDEQTLRIRVTNPAGAPVPEAELDATFTYGDQVHVRHLGRTDGHGDLRVTLSGLDFPPGRDVVVVIRVYGLTGSVLGSRQLMFQTWW